LDTHFLDVLRTYFRGEWLECTLFVLPVGVVSVAVSLLLLRGERSPFVWGVTVPSLVLGVALLVTGVAVASRTPGQVQALTTAYQQDVATFVARELARMQRVNANWPVYLVLYAVFAVAGLALRFLVRREWAVGAGTALVLFAGLGLLIDGFAERRARPYTAALESLQGSKQPI
jgi:uncharacterized membrane protein HdeD (DUF308 family)